MARGIVEQLEVPDAESASVIRMLHNTHYTPELSNGQSDHEHSTVATFRKLGLDASMDRHAVSQFVGASLFSIAERCKVRIQFTMNEVKSHSTTCSVLLSQGYLGSLSAPVTSACTCTIHPFDASASQVKAKWRNNRFIDFSHAQTHCEHRGMA